MIQPTISEKDLCEFFGVEPRRADLDVPWPYNELTFETDVGDYAVRATVLPASGDFALSIAREDSELYSLNVRQANDFLRFTDGAKNTLQIVASDDHKIWLRLSPALYVGQSAGEA